MADEFKYSGSIKVGFYLPVEGLLFILKNPDETQREEKPYKLNGIWYNDRMELIQAVANHVDADIEVFGDLTKDDDSHLYIAFVPRDDKKYRINGTLTCGEMAFGPDYKVRYLMDNLKVLADIKKRLDDIGIWVKEPVIFQAWVNNDPKATVITR